MEMEAKSDIADEVLEMVDDACGIVRNAGDVFRKIGGLALRCAMTGRMDLVYRIRGAFDGVVKSAETAGAFLDGIVELKDQFHVG